MTEKAIPNNGPNSAELILRSIMLALTVDVTSVKLKIPTMPPAGKLGGGVN